MLYIVSTPIGNLQDITLRAIETLKGVDLIACEDTRHTKILLDHYQIKKPLTSYHSYNKAERGEYLLNELRAGKNIALVSDAGTPGISDPGVHLVKAAIQQDIPFTVIPGPTAFISSLVLSGLPAHKFIFEGFLPVKVNARLSRLKALAEDGRTIILYESCHRILKLMEELFKLMADREICLCREITKKFEEVKRGSPGQLLEYFKLHKPRGEFTVIF